MEIKDADCKKVFINEGGKEYKLELFEKKKIFRFTESYSFNVGLAQKYGINESIILNNLIFWIKKNIANEKHFYDGCFWTYNSINAFKEIFPFWSERQIGYILKSLEDKNIIKKGNYNKKKYDRTLWYTVIDSTILQICNMDYTNLSNGFDNSVKPIPVINTDKKPDINVVTQEDIEEIKKTYPNKCPIKNSSTNKSNYNKDKLIKIIKTKGKEECKKIIILYLADCKKGNRYIKNFKTFVNNFPSLEDYEDSEKKQTISIEEEQRKLDENMKRCYGERN